MSAMDPSAARSIKLDKGCLRIPAAFCEPLRGANHVFVTNYLYHQERSLMLFVPDEWGRFQAKFHNMRPMPRHVLLYETFIIGGSAGRTSDRGCIGRRARRCP